MGQCLALPSPAVLPVGVVHTPLLSPCRAAPAQRVTAPCPYQGLLLIRQPCWGCCPHALVLCMHRAGLGHSPSDGHGDSVPVAIADGGVRVCSAGGWEPLVVCSPRGLCLCPEDVCKGGCWLLRLFCVFMLCLAQEGECCSSCGAWGEQVLELHPGSWVQLGCLQT